MPEPGGATQGRRAPGDGIGRCARGGSRHPEVSRSILRARFSKNLPARRTRARRDPAAGAGDERARVLDLLALRVHRQPHRALRPAPRLAGAGEHRHAALPAFWVCGQQQPPPGRDHAQAGHPAAAPGVVAVDLGQAFEPAAQLPCSRPNPMKTTSKSRANCIDTAQRSRGGRRRDGTQSKDL